MLYIDSELSHGTRLITERHFLERVLSLLTILLEYANIRSSSSNIASDIIPFVRASLRRLLCLLQAACINDIRDALVDKIEQGEMKSIVADFVDEEVPLWAESKLSLSRPSPAQVVQQGTKIMMIVK